MCWIHGPFASDQQSILERDRRKRRDHSGYDQFVHPKTRSVRIEVRVGMGAFQRIGNARIVWSNGQHAFRIRPLPLDARRVPHFPRMPRPCRPKADDRPQVRSNGWARGLLNALCCRYEFAKCARARDPRYAATPFRRAASLLGYCIRPYALSAFCMRTVVQPEASASTINKYFALRIMVIRNSVGI